MRVSKSISIDSRLLDRSETVAQKNGENLSEFVEEAVRRRVVQDEKRLGLTPPKTDGERQPA